MSPLCGRKFRQRRYGGKICKSIQVRFKQKLSFLTTRLIKWCPMENFSGKILSCYEQHALELPLRKLGPFFLRAYKMTADKKYYNILAWHLFCIVIPRFLLLHEKALQKDFSLPKNLKKYTGTPKNMRAVKRSLFYKNNPSVEFLDLFTEYLFSIKRYGLYKTILKKEYNQAMGVLREVNFKNI